jgi:putative NIF3 family GTP cyclohydrolase 1 type 2
MAPRWQMKALNGIAPTQHAASWDNVGLLVGVPQQLIRWQSADSRSDAVLMTAGHDSTTIVMQHP